MSKVLFRRKIKGDGLCLCPYKMVIMIFLSEIPVIILIMLGPGQRLPIFVRVLIILPTSLVYSILKLKGCLHHQLSPRLLLNIVHSMKAKIPGIDPTNNVLAYRISARFFVVFVFCLCKVDSIMLT